MRWFSWVLAGAVALSLASAVEAGAATAERLGWETVWTTDHVLVPAAAAAEYGRTFDAIETLVWVGARHPHVKLGTSVIVVPQRNAVVLAKELATLDVLSDGRLIAGVGVGWNETEFANLAAEDRFHRRGAYLDETIRLWRHLWSGSSEPFTGTFHNFSDFVFGPVPVQGEHVPILVGGTSAAALRRAGTLGDGYHATRVTPAEMALRVPVIRAAAEAAGRPMPPISARLALSSLGDGPAAILEQVRGFEAVGVEHLAIVFAETDPSTLRAAIERFDTDVVRASAG